MQKSSVRRSDVLEREYEASILLLTRAGIALLIFLFLLYFFRSLYPVPSMVVLASIGIAVTVVLLALGGWRVYQTHKTPTVTVNCPYCDHPMQFLATPTQDYDCEQCHRRVYYENGQPVPVRPITCPICHTEYKVSEKVGTFTCERCNRVLRLTEPSRPDGIVAEQTEVMRNYDVLLTEVGRNRNEVAMSLQSILVCNLVEARRQMENLPLTLVRNVPERKAYAIRDRLRELGATCIVRATADEQVPGRRP